MCTRQLIVTFAVQLVFYTQSHNFFMSLCSRRNRIFKLFTNHATFHRSCLVYAHLVNSTLQSDRKRLVCQKRFNINVKINRLE